MLTIITDSKQIERLQNTFEKKMSEVTDRQMKKAKVGWPGDSEDYNVSVSRNLDIWWYHDIIPKRRYWNIFGAGTPKRLPYSNSIVCEINFPLQGINRKVSGVFVRDESGNAYAVHRGRIGGGKAGVGKELFWTEFRGEPIQANEDGQAEELALIAALESNRLPRQVSTYVHEVDRIKNKVEITLAAKKTYRSKIADFKAEFFGEKRYPIESSIIEAQCDHGTVVNKLATVLESHKFKIGKNVPIDLCVLDKNNEVEVLFEVKTDAETTSCYKAIGQLLFNSLRLPSKPRPVAVFPSTLDSETMTILKKLGIACLTYSWNKNQEVCFDKDPTSHVK